MLRSAALAILLAFLPTFAESQEEVQTQQTTHEVVKGETLWSLAERYYGNPYRWSVLYRANESQISNPDVLEPGQVLLIPESGRERTTVQVENVTVSVSAGDPVEQGFRVPETPEAGGRLRVASSGRERTIFYPEQEEEPDLPTMALLATAEGRESIRAVSTAAVPLGLVYAAEWLEDAGEEWASLGTVAGLTHVHVERAPDSPARQGESVLIRLRPDARVEVGDLLQSYHTLRVDRKLGRVQAPTGILVVTHVQPEGVEAVVSSELGRLSEGDRIRPAPTHLPVPGVFPTPVESNVSARILGFPDRRTLHGYGARVFLDVGVPEGIVIGDVFRAPITRVGPGFGAEAARLQVVLVEGSRSTARIVSLSQPGLRPGAVLRLIGKMHSAP